MNNVATEKVTGYAVVYENKLMKNISCSAVCETKEQAEKFVKENEWFYDRCQIVEVQVIGFKK